MLEIVVPRDVLFHEDAANQWNMMRASRVRGVVIASSHREDPHSSAARLIVVTHSRAILSHLDPLTFSDQTPASDIEAASSDGEPLHVVAGHRSTGNSSRRSIGPHH